MRAVVGPPVQRWDTCRLVRTPCSVISYVEADGSDDSPGSPGQLPESRGNPRCGAATAPAEAIPLGRSPARLRSQRERNAVSAWS
jgi:hypothetical protein